MRHILFDDSLEILGDLAGGLVGSVKEYLIGGEVSVGGGSVIVGRVIR